jgi:hypothetical protein
LSNAFVLGGGPGPWRCGLTVGLYSNLYCANHVGSAVQLCTLKKKKVVKFAMDSDFIQSCQALLEQSLWYRFDIPKNVRTRMLRRMVRRKAFPGKLLFEKVNCATATTLLKD